MAFNTGDKLFDSTRKLHGKLFPGNGGGMWTILWTDDTAGWSMQCFHVKESEIAAKIEAGRWELEPG